MSYLLCAPNLSYSVVPSSNIKMFLLLLGGLLYFSCALFLQPVNPFSDSAGLNEDGLEGQAQLYDPCFLLPLLTQQLDPSKIFIATLHTRPI